MEITFKTQKLQNIFSSQSSLIKKYGVDRGRKIMRRISLLLAAQNLNEIPPDPPTRRHRLSGNRKGQFAVNINENYRLVFEPNYYPLPLKKDGGIDLELITSIKILDVEDYH